MDLSAGNSTSWELGSSTEKNEIFELTTIEWVVSKAYALSIKLVGFICHCIVLDILNKLPESRFTKWSYHFVFWAIAYLTKEILDEIQSIGGFQFDQMSRVYCKSSNLVSQFTVHATGLIGNAAAIDLVLSLKYPSWHYQLNENKIIPRVSVFIALFCFFYFLPGVLVFDIENGFCVRASTKMAALWEKFGPWPVDIFGFFLLVSTSIVIAIELYKLRKKEEQRKKKPVENKKTFSTQKADGTNDGVKANISENKQQMDKHVFTEDDIRLITSMLFMIVIFIVILISIIVFWSLKSLFNVYWLEIFGRSMINFFFGLSQFLVRLRAKDFRNMFARRYLMRS